MASGIDQPMKAASMAMLTPVDMPSRLMSLAGSAEVSHDQLRPELKPVIAHFCFELTQRHS